MPLNINRIGVMTCGGDCPGLNAVLRAVVLTAVEKYGWAVLGIEDSMQGLIDLDYRSPNGNVWLDVKKVEDIIGKGGTILGCDNHSDPFRYPVREGTKKVEKDVSDRVIENYKKLGLDALIVIGGDGSMRIANRLSEKSGGLLRIVGVPKTIDNDLDGTDVTFGFGTAVQTIVDAVDKIRDTARSHDRVIIVEVMGRDAGWLALYGAIAATADVCLIPEIPYSVSTISRFIRKKSDQGRPFMIILMAEGAKPIGGTESIVEAKAGEMRRYQGASSNLAEALEADSSLRTEVRVSVLGYIQRGGSPIQFDRIVGTRFGVAAVELIAQGKFGELVSLRGQDITSVPIKTASQLQKLVDPNGQLVQAARTVGISFGDENSH